MLTRFYLFLKIEKYDLHVTHLISTKTCKNTDALPMVSLLSSVRFCDIVVDLFFLIGVSSPTLSLASTSGSGSGTWLLWI